MNIWTAWLFPLPRNLKTRHIGRLVRQINHFTYVWNMEKQRKKVRKYTWMSSIIKTTLGRMMTLLPKIARDYKSEIQESFRSKHVYLMCLVWLSTTVGLLKRPFENIQNKNSPLWKQRQKLLLRFYDFSKIGFGHEEWASALFLAYSYFQAILSLAILINFILIKNGVNDLSFFNKLLSSK